MNTKYFKYFVFIAAVFATVQYLLAGSAPVAPQAPVARHATVAPVAPSSVAPSASVGPVAPIGPMPSIAPTPPVIIAPIANPAPVAPTQPQSANPNVPNGGYTFTSGTSSPNFTNGVPTAGIKSRKSVYWVTNPPYGNPVSGYTNRTVPAPVRRAAPLITNNFTSPNQK